MAVTPDDLTKLTGAQKAAILILSLSDDNATKLFSLMSEDEIADISRAMSQLGAISPEVIDHIIQDVSDQLTGSSVFLGNLQNTERLLGKVLDPDRVSMLVDEIRGPQGRNTWEKLTNVNEELLAVYFRNEHPQTAALVLSKISPNHAAKVISSLPESFAFEVIARILNLGTVKKEVLEKVEKILRAEFISSVGKTQKSDSFEMLAEIFNNLDRSSEVKFMSMLESNLPDAASKVKDKMFTFEDLTKIDPKGIQRILRDVEKSMLTLALKGADEALKELIFSSMSQRAAKIMKDELEALGSVRLKEVDAARAKIILTTKRLIEEGEVDAVRGDDDDEFVT